MTRSSRHSTSRIKKYLLWLAVIFAIFCLSVVGFLWRFWGALHTIGPGEEEPIITKVPSDKKSPINALLLGTDGERSDTMIFASYNPETEKFLLLSIPRDTLVYIPGTSDITGKPYGEDKINSAYATKGGIQKSIETVELFLGVDIHYFARIKYRGLHRLVDAIGGVPIDVNYNMNYDDNAGGLHIHLSKGHQVLDGDKAEQYLRWRKNSNGTGDGLGDLGRVQRQQKFMMAFAEQALQARNILRLGELLDIVDKNVYTNLDFDVAFRMATQILGKVNADNFQEFVTVQTVPGDDYWEHSVSYYKVEGENREALDNIINNFFALEAAQGMKIEVLNGSGINGAAGEVAKRLERRFPNSIIEIDNADSSNYALTEVISRTDEALAKSVAALVRADNNIYKDVKEEGDPDITIIVGKDYKN